MAKATSVFKAAYSTFVAHFCILEAHFYAYPLSQPISTLPEGHLRVSEVPHYDLTKLRLPASKAPSRLSHKLTTGLLYP